MERVNSGRAARMRSRTLKRLEAFYAAEYSKLAKILVLLGATIEEAERSPEGHAGPCRALRDREGPGLPGRLRAAGGD